MNSRALAAEVRATARAATPKQRAQLLYDLTRAVYDAVKFDNPEGEGLDGADGPERHSLGLVGDEAMRHIHRMAEPRLMPPEGLNEATPSSSVADEGLVILEEIWVKKPNEEVMKKIDNISRGARHDARHYRMRGPGLEDLER